MQEVNGAVLNFSLYMGFSLADALPLSSFFLGDLGVAVPYFSFRRLWGGPLSILRKAVFSEPFSPSCSSFFLFPHHLILDLADTILVSRF